MRVFTLIFSVLVLCFSCSNDDKEPDSDLPNVFSYNFSSGNEGWVAGYADYPSQGDTDFELVYEHRSLPEPLNTNEKALYQSGNNHSDDLCMYVKKKLTGLLPEHTYSVEFSIEIASNIPDGTTGVGGSPGESVTIKAGASAEEPENIIINGNYRLNIDKGNQTNGGDDMIVIGDFSNDTDKSEYVLKQLNNKDTSFSTTTNDKGELWVIVGTDSGFESTTSIYYNSVVIRLE